MRNLKRALSLALASVMVLGLMVVGSGASYADVTSEENQEAIEVLQAVGVMVGDDEGNFNPDKNVTRNEMAVVMSNLLDLKVEDFNAADIPFTDVPSWAVAYVAACYADGITSGTSATTYGGSNTVTAAQAALMMMKALGYFQYQGDFEQDWTLATIKKGSEIGIFDGITVDRTSPLTRNDVAQMALNALKSNMVTFTGEVGIEIPTANGNVVVGYNPEYTARTSANRQYNSIDVGTTDIASNNQYYVQLGEELYGGDLQLRADTDVFGRPARYWEYDGKEIGTYVNESLMIAEFTTAVSGDEMYDVLTRNTVANYGMDIALDGEYEDSNAFTKNDINRRNDADLKGTGRGVLTQVFVDNDDDIVTVTMINTWLAIADEDYNEKKDQVKVTVYGINTNGDVAVNGDYHDGFTLDGEDFLIEDIAEGDALLVTVADDEIQTIATAEAIAETEIAEFGTDGNYPDYVEVDGTKYDFARTSNYDWSVLEDYTGVGAVENLKDTIYTVYLDAYGNAIGVKVVEGTTNYLFITGIDLNGSNRKNQNADATVIFLDGTMDGNAKINMEKSVWYADPRDAADPDDNAILNTWCTYTVNKDGVYTVKEVADSVANYTPGDYDTDRDGKDDLTIKASQFNWSGLATEEEIDSKHITLRGHGTARNLYYSVYGNDDTVYLTVGLDKLNNVYGVIDDVVSVTTGIDNANLTVWTEADAEKEAFGATVPAGAQTSNGTFALYDKNGDIIAAIVVGEDSGATKNLVYAHDGDVKSERYNSSTGEWTWKRDVIFNGEEVTLTEVGDGLSELKKMGTGGNWFQVKYNADGNVVEVLSISEAGLTFPEVVNNYNRIANAVQNEDNVLYYQNVNIQNLEMSGKTLFVNTRRDTGFSVAEDVKVALIQYNNNVEKTYFESGYKALENIVDELNDRHANYQHNYTFSAILEEGIAQVVVINDISDLCDPYQDPSWGTPTGDVDDVVLSATQILLYDKRDNPLGGNGMAWALYMRGPSQASFDVALDGKDFSVDYLQIAPFMSGKTGYSFYVVVDGVKSNTITI